MIFHANSLVAEPVIFISLPLCVIVFFCAIIISDLNILNYSEITAHPRQISFA